MAMRGLGVVRGVGAAAVMLLLATACGGDDSSGLATLAEASTTAPAADPEEIEPVSEPTGLTQPAAETTEASDPVTSAEADPAGTGTDETAAVATTSEPGDTTGEGSLGAGEVIDEEFAEPDDLAAVPEDLSDEERLLAFAECMRENGVDFPDPVVEADGTVTFGFRPGGGAGAAGLQELREVGRDPDLPAARDVCGGMLEGLAFGPGQGGFDLIELQDTLLAFAQCMRDHGVDMGDPDLSRFGPGAGNDDEPGVPFRIFEIDGSDPDFAAAFEVCQQQLPQAGGPRFGGGN